MTNDFRFFLVADPYSPSLTIETSQAPDEGILPTGYNHSIICISNISEKFYGNPYYGQPYWIQIFFNEAYVRSCGGRSSDSEDSKICTYPIVNSVEADSGNYTCVARNQLSCIIGTLPVKFESKSAVICQFCPFSPLFALVVHKGPKS